MCRSQGERGGPRRCPAHARAQLQKSIAAVEELEKRETQLQAALAVAVAAVQRSHRASQRLAMLEDAVGVLERAAEDEIDDDPEYLGLREDVEAARSEWNRARPVSAAALAAVDRSRAEVAEVLVAGGMSGEQAAAHLDGVERASGFRPPF